MKKLWESQWVEESRGWEHVGILWLLIQHHGCFPLGIHWLACVYCHDQWGGMVHREFRHCRTGEFPLLLAMPMQPLGVTPSQFPWNWSATLGPAGCGCRSVWTRSRCPSCHKVMESQMRWVWALSSTQTPPIQRWMGPNATGLGIPNHASSCRVNIQVWVAG